MEVKRAKKKRKKHWTHRRDSLNTNFQVDSDLSLRQWPAVGVYYSHVGQGPTGKWLHMSSRAIYKHGL